MATRTEALSKAKQLVGDVSRMLCDDEEQVILHLLNMRRDHCIRASKLDSFVAVDPSQSRRVLERLVEERLLLCLRDEVLTDGERDTVYYLDYDNFALVVAYRFFSMKATFKMRDSSLRAGFQALYLCTGPSCGKQYRGMEVSRLSAHGGQLVCPACGATVEEQAQGVAAAQQLALLDKFNFQCGAMDRLARQLTAKDVELPTNRPVTKADEDAKERAREEAGRGHRGAKTSAMVYGEIKEEEQQSNSIMTHLANSGSEEPAAKRQAKQQMPGFLQVSSVTGLARGEASGGSGQAQEEGGSGGEHVGKALASAASLEELLKAEGVHGHESSVPAPAPVAPPAPLPAQPEPTPAAPAEDGTAEGVDEENEEEDDDEWED